MAVHRHDGRVVGDEPALGEAGHEQVLDLVLGGVAAAAVLLADPGEGLVLGLVDGPAGAGVALDLPVVEAAEELLHQLARGDHLDAQRADELERAGVDPGQVGDAGHGEVLHGEPPAGQAGEHVLQAGPEGLPGGVALAPARDVGREGAQLDGVDEQARLAAGRDEVGPAPGEHVAAEPQRADGGGVLAVEVVEEPAVELLARRWPAAGPGCPWFDLRTGLLDGHPVALARRRLEGDLVQPDRVGVARARRAATRRR